MWTASPSLRHSLYVNHVHALTSGAGGVRGRVSALVVSWRSGLWTARFDCNRTVLKLSTTLHGELICKF